MIDLLGGESHKNQISFYAASKEATAIRNGTIETTVKTKKVDRTVKNFINSFGIGILPWIIKAFILVPLIENGTIKIIFYLLPAAFYGMLTIYNIIYLRCHEGKAFLMNHAAEHMVFAAYNKLKRIPTIEEASQFSRISSLCGSTIKPAFITIQLIAFAIFVYSGMVIPEIILYFIALFFHSVFPFNILGRFTQLFLTCKPKDSNIELAIAALSSLEKEIINSSL